MSQHGVEILLRGYRAFVAGDLETIEGMLDPEVEWIGVGEVAAVADRADVLDVLRDRVAEDYQVTVDRCIGVGEVRVLDDSGDSPGALAAAGLEDENP
jgi:hypothetical protein